ncbi:MAG: MBL fold metallo-hydrolase [Prevotella sp.]
MLNFISFGSGSSGNSYFLYTETSGILIDAGIGTRTLKKRFADYGLSLDRISAVLITHDHADHVKSVGSLSSDLSLPVYATQQVLKGIEENYCVRKKIRPGYERKISYGETVDVCDFGVTCFHVPHDSVDNVGYEIRYGDTVFCLITDAGYVTEEMKRRIQSANYLVIEANYEHEKLIYGPYPEHLKRRIVSNSGHLSNTDCAIALAENATPALRHAWLAHLSEENNHPELARKTVEQKLREHGIVPGEDFMLDVLKRKTPSEIFTLA